MMIIGDAVCAWSIHIEIGIQFTKKTLVKSHDNKNLNLLNLESRTNLRTGVVVTTTSIMTIPRVHPPDLPAL